VRREVGDRRGEGQDLGNLGAVSAEIGRFAQAIDYYEQAIEIELNIDDKIWLDLKLNNLSQLYFLVGNTIEAMRLLDETRVVARETSYRMVESGVDVGAGDLELFRGNYQAAISAFEKSIEVADDIGLTQVQGEARAGAALARLLSGDPVSARQLVEAARRYHFPLQDVHNSVLLGVVAYRQRDLNVAKRAFAAAIDLADALRTMTPERYAALDAKAIALCGLALCGDTEKTIAARAAFRAARAVTSAAGVVHKVLQLFDALAVADQSHFLVDIRPYAAGDSTESPSDGT
jgi:tetratricopeptide (TPR) repeat protein